MAFVRDMDKLSLAEMPNLDNASDQGENVLAFRSLLEVESNHFTASKHTKQLSRSP
jgi:hypothetical protein